MQTRQILSLRNVLLPMFHHVRGIIDLKSACLGFTVPHSLIFLTGSVIKSKSNI